MKLFILKNLNEEIIAITEFKYAMTTFCLQIDFNEFKYIVMQIKNPKEINKYLIKYNDLYLMEFNNFMIREKDYNIFLELIDNEKRKIKETITNLLDISDTYSLLPNENKQIFKTIKILKTKNKNFNSSIDLTNMIKNYYTNKSFQDYMNEIYLHFNNK